MKKKLFSPALLALFLLASCGNGGGGSLTPVTPGSSNNPPASSQPAGDSSQPAGDSSQPAGESSQPAGESSQPAGDSSQPAGDSSQPAGDSSQPAGDSSQPAGDSSQPAGESSQPAGESSQPAGDSSQPAGESSQSAAQKTEYVFEAEYCPCIEEMDGATYSGGTGSYGLIGKDRDHDMNASGGCFVHFMYVQGSVLEFNIHSDRDIDDVKFVARFSAEYRSIDFNWEIYPIYVNGVDEDYGTIKIKDVPINGEGNKAFEDFLLFENVHFQKGNNEIQFKVDNNILMFGTALSTAPMIDCIKLTTAATLTWPEECRDNLDQLG